MAEESNGQQEVNRKRFAVLEQIVDRARSEPAWKEKLVSDPHAAFREAGLLPDDFDPATADVVGQATMVEYGLMVSLIAMVCIGVKGS